MGKIVKYCNSCDEGFGERFTFCPVCGASLQAFEMNPLTGKVEEPAPEPTPPQVVAEPPVEEVAKHVEPDVATVAAPVAAASIFESHVEPEQVKAAEPVNEVTAQTPVEETVDHEYDYLDMPATTPSYAYTPSAASAPVDESYHLTMIEETNGKQRNGLLIGASIFMLSFVAFATLYSLFSIALDVNSIGDTTSLAYLTDEVPVPVDDEKPKPDKSNAGGGGGGGKNEPTPASRGDLVNQTEHPLRPPDANDIKMTDPLPLPPASTQGNMKFPPKYDRTGLPNGLDGAASNGMGSGGGLGNGFGTGQGNGSGSGAGNGNGSGYGNGNGRGNGNGNGDGNDGAPPPSAMAVTSALKVLSKPRAQYTDQARTNNVQGVVRLKITLNANGSVGSITPLNNLPYGLTEQAIAAARQIKFEPRKVNGVPQSSIVTFEYSFTIY
jgi:TonB family protein